MNPTWVRSKIAGLANSAEQVIAYHDRLVEAFEDNPTATAKVDLLLTDEERQGLGAIIARCKIAEQIISDRQEAIALW